MFYAEPKIDLALLNDAAQDRKLGEDAVFVFNLHVEIVRLEHGSGFLQDADEAPGEQAMIGVVRHPRLEGAGRNPAEHAAAIQEAAVGPSDLGNVGVGRNATAVGENEAELGFGSLRKLFAEFSDFHNGAASFRAVVGASILQLVYSVNGILLKADTRGRGAGRPGSSLAF
jgi:hypothetical protein